MPAARLVATVAATLALAACSTPVVEPASETDDRSSAAPDTSKAPLPASVEDPAPHRLAVCLQSTGGATSPTADLANQTLSRLAGLVGEWAPADQPEDSARPPLEVMVRPLVDMTTGSSFAQAPLFEVAVPAMPPLPKLESSAEGDIDAAAQDRLDAAGARRAEATAAARGWTEHLRRASAEGLEVTSDDATRLDIVGCAIAAGDWLRRPAADGGEPARTVLLVVSSGEVENQDIAANPYANAGALADVGRIVMLSTCGTNDRCENRRRSWGFFTALYVGRDDPFVARDVTAAMVEVRKELDPEATS